jgi:hypothetical protein
MNFEAIGLRPLDNGAMQVELILAMHAVPSEKALQAHAGHFNITVPGTIDDSFATLAERGVTVLRELLRTEHDTL